MKQNDTLVPELGRISERRAESDGQKSRSGGVARADGARDGPTDGRTRQLSRLDAIAVSQAAWDKLPEQAD